MQHLTRLHWVCTVILRHWALQEEGINLSMGIAQLLLVGYGAVGVDLSVVQKALGHSAITVTQGYLPNTTPVVEAAFDDIERHRCCKNTRKNCKQTCKQALNKIYSSS